MVTLNMVPCHHHSHKDRGRGRGIVKRVIQSRGRVIEALLFFVGKEMREKTRKGTRVEAARRVGVVVVYIREEVESEQGLDLGLAPWLRVHVPNLV